MPDQLVFDHTYNFTLMVTSLNTNSSHSTYQLITVVAQKSHQLRIKCIRNCRSQEINPQSMFHLKAICLTCINASGNFVWDIFPPLFEHQLTSSRLVIESNVFSSGKSYKFNVSVSDGNGNGIATIEMTTPENITGSCTVEPSEGYEYSTEFRVTCSDSHTSSFLYVLFQGETQLLISNNHVFTSKLNANDSVRARIQNSNGQYIQQTLNVSIKESTMLNSIEEINDIFTSNNVSLDLHRIINEDPQSNAIVFINTVADRLTKLKPVNGSDVVSRIVDMMKELGVTNFVDIAPIAQTILKLVEPVPMNHKLALRCATMLDKISTTLKSFDGEMSVADYIITSNDVLSMMNQLIDPFETIPPAQNVNPLISHEYHAEDYGFYGDLDFGIFEKLENLETVTTSIEKLLIGMAFISALSFRPMEMLGNITSDDIQLETLAFDQEVAGSHSLKVNGTTVVVTVSEELLLQFDGDASISCTFFNKNPMWWFSDGSEINSDVVGVSIHKSDSDLQENVKEITKLQSPLQISMEIKNKTQAQRNETLRSSSKMRTFKIKCPTNGLISLNITQLSGDASISVYFTNHSMVLNEISNVNPAITINGTNQETSSNSFNFKCSMAIRSLVFMSIVINGPTTNSSTGDVDLTFQLNSIQCLHWDTDSNTWQSDGCSVDLELIADRIDCKCSHLSLFAVKHQKSDFCGVTPDASLFPMKSVIWICLLFLSLSFFIMMLWAWRRENLDNNNQNWIHLKREHTASRPQYYAVTVITGSRQNANTTSHVAIKIHGSEYTTQIIPLFDRGVQLFQRGSINNFIITTNKSIGQIRNITLCVDCHGPHPSWYCEAVIIRDLMLSEEWNFDVKRWLPRKTGDKSFTVSIPVLAEKEYFKRKRLLGLHWTDILLSSYSLFSACMCRSDGRLSRVEKVYIGFASIEMGLMANVIFFSYNQDDSQFVRNFLLSVVVGVGTACLFRMFSVYLLLKSGLVTKNRKWKKMFRSELI